MFILNFLLSLAGLCVLGYFVHRHCIRHFYTDKDAARITADVVITVALLGLTIWAYCSLVEDLLDPTLL